MKTGEKEKEVKPMCERLCCAEGGVKLCLPDLQI